MNAPAPVLEVEGLSVAIGARRVVDATGFALAPGEVLALVGESGCGKSMTALALLGLLPAAARLEGGRIGFEGRDLARLPERELRALRGNRISVIFQDPSGSLDPLMTVGAQLAEGLRAHRRMGREEAHERSLAMLRAVGISEPERRLAQYPFELSGGMCQRVMIAIALAAEPAVLLADEPTTALDVTIQAQILDLLRDLQREMGMAIVIITHNMGVIAEFADRVAVMYAGRIAEEGPVGRIFDAPTHPYTAGLLSSTPDLICEVPRLRTIPGTLPSLYELPPGCRFAPRCGRRVEACEAGRPATQEIAPGHFAACIRAREGASA